MKGFPGWIWPLILLFLVLVINGILDPQFFAITWQGGELYGNLIDIFNRSVPVLLIAIGMSLVIATGGIDLSVGAVLAITGAIAASLVARPDESPLSALQPISSVPLILAISLAIALFIGIFNGLLVTKLKLQPIIATLILMVAGRGIAQLLSGGQNVNFQSDAFAAMARGHFLSLPNPIWIAGAIVLMTFLVTRKSALGLFIEAIGSNEEAAIRIGLSPSSIKLVVYGVCALLAGVAGLITTADIQNADANQAGLYIELDAILAVSLGGASLAGGRFSLIGTVLGALLLQAVTTTVFAQGIPVSVTLILKAFLVILLVLLQSPEFRKITKWRKTVEA